MHFLATHITCQSPTQWTLLISRIDWERLNETTSQLCMGDWVHVTEPIYRITICLVSVYTHWGDTREFITRTVELWFLVYSWDQFIFTVFWTKTTFMFAWRRSLLTRLGVYSFKWQHIAERTMSLFKGQGNKYVLCFSKFKL